MKNTIIYTIAKWQIKENHLQDVMNLLPELVNSSTAETGNLHYQVLQSNTDARTLLLYEAYQDEKALENHRSSVHFKTIVLDQLVPMLEHREVLLMHEIFPKNLS